jgi:hypothetical protein
MFPQGIWALPQEKLAFLWGTIMSSEKNYFSLKNMVALHGNSNLVPLGTWLFPREQIKPFFYLHLENLFSSISFINEKDNSGKGLNPRPMDYKGNSNPCISFFL